MQTADKCVGRGREGGRRWLAASLLVNWKPCRRARNLPEIPIDRGILRRGRRRGGGAGVQMPRSMTAIFYTAGGQSPWWPRTVRAKLQLFARKRAMGGGRGGRRAERWTPGGEREKGPLPEKSMLMTGERCHTQADTHCSAHASAQICKGHIM